MFSDFVPKQTPTSQRVVAEDGAYVHCYITESLDDVLKRMNRFINDLDGQLVNVETLQFPSVDVVSKSEHQTVSHHFNAQLYSAIIFGCHVGHLAIPSAKDDCSSHACVVQHPQA